MTAPDGSFPEMRPRLLARSRRMTLVLDDYTAERLVGGSMASADAPPGYRAVAATLHELGQAPSGAELVDQHGAVSTIAAAIRADAASAAPRPRPRWSSRVRGAALAVAVVAGGISVTTGLAVAGALPGRAQAAASSVLAQLGISTPGGTGHTDGRLSPHRVEDTGGPVNSSVHLSGPAATENPVGTDLGGQASTRANNGQSQPGNHANPAPGPPASNPSGAPTDRHPSSGHDPTGTPNAGAHGP